MYISSEGLPGSLGEVPLFKYLGRTLSSSENDSPAVEQNLQKSQGEWGRLEEILGREGVDRIMTGRFYLAVVQAVLIFGSETWVLTPRFEKSLKGFHHRVVQRMSGMFPKR